MPEVIEKAESSNPKIKVPLGVERGQPRIVTSGHFIQTSKKKDLRMPNALCTFDEMAMDDAVSTSIKMTNNRVKYALTMGKFKPKGKSQKSKVAADFLNYCIHNMSYGSWLDAVNNIVTDIQYGYSLLNIVTEKRDYGEYRGATVLKKLAPRDQKSVYGWLWDKNRRDLKGFVQKPNITGDKQILNAFAQDGIFSLSSGFHVDNKFPVLYSYQLLHSTYNSTLNNPQGNCPLINCYTAWKEKKLIEQYQLVAISKGYGGTVILRVPSELIEAAESGTNPGAAASLAALQSNAEKYNSGESSYIMLTSDLIEGSSSKPIYDVEFKGVEGSVSDVDTLAIVTAKQKSIYNCFGTSFILLGQDGVGSYSLSKTGDSVHGQYVADNILEKENLINTQLIPKLLAANDVSLNWSEMPYFEAADPYEFDLDTVSKFIQRVGSVQKLTPSMMRMFLEKMDLDPDEADELDYTDKGQSRSGDGMKEGMPSGTGNSKVSNSTTNMENKSLIKNLVVDGDRIIDTATDTILNLDDLDEEGNYK